MSKARMDRRLVLRTLAYGLGAMTLGRVVAACTQGTALPTAGRERDDDDSPTKDKAPSSSTPTDQDEHVPGTSTPIDTGDAPPKVPVAPWEARAKQLEAEQQRVYKRAAFIRGDEGVMAGKANSHEPKPKLVLENGRTRVEVTVEHVMGTPKPDGGIPGYDASTEGGASDGGTMGDAAPASDAAAPPPPPEHYITTVYLKAAVAGVERVVGLWEFDVTDPAPPTVRFTLPEGVSSVTAYEWCTLHGLWKAPPLAVG
jgi:hypothetical protein